MNTPERRKAIDEEIKKIESNFLYRRKFVKAIFDKSNHNFKSLNWFRYYMGNLNFEFANALPFSMKFAELVADNIKNLYNAGFVDEDECTSMCKVAATISWTSFRFPLLATLCMLIHKIKKESK